MRVFKTTRDASSTEATGSQGPVGIGNKNIDHSCQGLSLIELLIAMAIFAIIAAMAVPSLKNYSDSSRITTVTNELVAAINRARTEAMKRNEQVVLCPANFIEDDVASTSCGSTTLRIWSDGWITYVTPRTDTEVLDMPDAYPVTCDETNVAILNCKAGVSSDRLFIRSDDEAASYIGFLPSGLLRVFADDGTEIPIPANESDPITFSVCDDRGEAKGRVVMVSTMGRVRVDKTNTTNDTTLDTDCYPET